ncbi:MAG: imidazole glycerol phosphate synthase subunit HisH [Magnetococcales bacterium]|nr:imidazole glycerol phosphate synthase subunit HisH [Magnetococcales bacterium]NGZ28833.1 imidazole glycerol phosphate synthase subunit HisH [Magnetococcales bacterium]
MKRVTVVDYGLGNLLSVRRAFEQCGAEVTISHSPVTVETADHLVVPGVGAFGKGMWGLRQNGLDLAIHQHVASGRPLLGICLGMQLLLDESDEFGVHSGLGLIPGRVVAIPSHGPDGSSHPIPHMGWNALHSPPGSPGWQGSLLSGIAQGEYCYFVHSFMANPHHSSHRLADCQYNGIAISAVIAKENILGCQFHPEKSGTVGLTILNTFLSL